MKNELSHAENAPANVPLGALRKRAHFRSHHRGCKEMDLVMGQFADSILSGLPDAELQRYDQLLDEDDMLIWDWVIGRSEAPEHYEALVLMLRKYAPQGA